MMLNRALGYAIAAILLALVLVSNDASAATARWDKETLNLFETLPVQEGGRVKPLDTVARFKLLKLNGRRSFRTEDGAKASSIEWLLDCLFYPEKATAHKTFLIDNSDVMVALGLPEKKRRDRYSYAELLPARERLFTLANQHAKTDSPSLLESQILNLANNVSDFELLMHYADFARKKIVVPASAALQALFPGRTELRLSEVLAQAPALAAKIHALNNAQQAADFEAVTQLFQQVEQATGMASAIALLPGSTAQEHWLTPAELTVFTLVNGASLPDQVAALAQFEQLVEARDDQARFAATARELHAGLVKLAQGRGEYTKIPTEVTYYKAQFFYYSLIMYIHAFILIAFSWLRPARKHAILQRVLGLVILAVPTLLLIAGITMRCIIRGRPPVTTLYETILFATAVAVVMALVVEIINRQRIALALGAVLGMLGVFLANKYEVREGADTMPSMVAVLDTNFWLATHVTTIAIGYGAGLLASAMAHVYVLGRLFKPSADPAPRARFARSVYGVLCFSLLFTLIGTVLGGIWGNESWGRFWGWDPKENGALMILLWQLAILHARRGGIIADLGVNVAAVMGGAVVAFSWFGVNLLGVGLHSYGFTSGTFAALLGFYVFEALIVTLGGIVWLRAKPA